MTSVSNRQTHWKTIQAIGIQRIERVVAEFYVECSDIPSRYFRVKVTEDNQGHFIGRINVSIKNATDNSPEWIAGLGESVDAALNDAIQQLMHQLDHCGKNKHQLTEDDFEWAACEDF
jgi:hypothetical protein